ncbi:hypothetical protein EJ03DRAFT_123604 [Teratosphaeria nubilosa]|uniref:Uncharacterized protein n=1 Tax=Teratosphaeria nubilosa TaxID=161662 RepID=A0A6G1LKQ9_9PEZI|nr:hypothetical protein EJ03DRAFT_123604 [Teratosphaeria nubilosa]
MKKTSRTPLTHPPEQVVHLSRRLQAALGFGHGTRLMGKKNIVVRLWEMPAAPKPPAKSDSADSLIDLDLADPSKPLPPGYFDKKRHAVNMPTSAAAPASFPRERTPTDQPIAPHQRTDSVSEPQKTAETIDLTDSPLLHSSTEPQATAQASPPPPKPASPLPSHTTPPFSSRPRPRHPIFWSTSLSTTINAWLAHPETRATQIPLTELKLLAAQPQPANTTTNNEQTTAQPDPQPHAPESKTLHTFTAPHNPTIKLTHLVLPSNTPTTTPPPPMGPPAPQKPLEWFVLTITHDGVKGDRIFDLGCPDLTSSSSDGDDEGFYDRINVQTEGVPWLVVAVPARQVTGREEVAEEEGAMGKKQRWTLGMQERVPIVQGFGVEVKGKALRLWTEACARGMGALEVVSEGELNV